MKTQSKTRAALGVLTLGVALAGAALGVGLTLALSLLIVGPAMASTAHPTHPGRPSFIGRLDFNQRPDPEQLALACCDQDGICVWVDTFGECAFPESAYYCEWGASNSDGTVSCYD
jgi:hypothetical protein